MFLKAQRGQALLRPRYEKSRNEDFRIKELPLDLGSRGVRHFCAPGQSAIEKLGKVTIDGYKLINVIFIGKNNKVFGIIK